MKRIVISGAAGTGKTTLAKWIANKYKIPFISSSTKELWPEFGIESHYDLKKLMREDPIWSSEFQRKVLDHRAKIMNENEEYVLDRGPLDNFTYYLLECSDHETEEESERFVDYVMNLYIERQTHQIFLPLILSGIEDDGKRITNPYYQFTVDSVLSSIRAHYAAKIPSVKHLIVPIWDFEQRTNLVMKFLSNLYFIDEKNNGQN